MSVGSEPWVVLPNLLPNFMMPVLTGEHTASKHLPRPLSPLHLDTHASNPAPPGLIPPHARAAARSAVVPSLLELPHALTGELTLDGDIGVSFELTAPATFPLVRAGGDGARQDCRGWRTRHVD